jgi:hypothetical protein
VCFARAENFPKLAIVLSELKLASMRAVDVGLMEELGERWRR